MLAVVSKKRYWAGLDNERVFESLDGWTLRALDGLKHIQDVWMLSELIDTHSQRVLEVGGANSRVLPALDASNEKWNLDEFKGAGNGPLEIKPQAGVNLVESNLGDFSDNLSNDYFDLVFSISVIEHIPESSQDAFWQDHARVLKDGGAGLHLIDLYLTDTKTDYVERRIDKYVELSSKHGLRLAIDSTLERPLRFRCSMASNTDWGMWRWNKAVPDLQPVREESQSVSLVMKVIKES